MPTVCSEVISRTKRRPQARRTTRKSVEAAACMNGLGLGLGRSTHLDAHRVQRGDFAHEEAPAGAAHHEEVRGGGRVLERRRAVHARLDGELRMVPAPCECE
jgi:hypothetical protein